MTAPNPPAQASDEPMRAAYAKWLHDRLFNDPPLPANGPDAYAAGFAAALAASPRATADVERLDYLYYQMCIKPFIAAICTKEKWLESIDKTIVATKGETT